MLKSGVLYTALVFAAVIRSAAAMEKLPAPAATTASARDAGVTDVLPERETSTSPVDLRVLRTIEAWLVRNFDLPAGRSLPAIRKVPPAQIAALHYRGQFNPLEPLPIGDTSTNDVVAAYDPRTETIYLPLQWTGASPVELSVLVHEMVHHLQKQAKLKYMCLQEGERLAYGAQDRWLHEAGFSLEKEFGIDALTQLVRGNCGFYIPPH
jgi:hypothetical protein